MISFKEITRMGYTQDQAICLCEWCEEKLDIIVADPFDDSNTVSVRFYSTGDVGYTRYDAENLLTDISTVRVSMWWMGLFKNIWNKITHG